MAVNHGRRVRSRTSGARPSRPQTSEPAVGSKEPIVGRSTLWLAAVAAAGRALEGPGPMLVTGPAGAGKLTLVRAASPHPVEVVDAALLPAEGALPWARQLRTVLNRPHRTVVIRHLHLLAEADLVLIAAVLDEAADATVAATVTGDRSDLVHPPLVDRFAAVIEVAPLAERHDDIAALAEAALTALAPGPLTRRLTRAALGALEACEWPGNTRQLVAAVRQGAARHPSGDVEPADLPAWVSANAAKALTVMERLESQAIRAALDHTGGRKTETAAELGISRSTLYRKLRAYGIATPRSDTRASRSGTSRPRP